LRPLRLAFIVKPDDADAILKAIQINTVLWGGMLNPIVPGFRRSPRSYADGRLKPPAAEILSGYLAAFDPDFVVPLGTALPPKVSFDASRVISPDAILGGLDEEELVHYGVGVNEVMAHLYAEEFRFARRHPVEAVFPESQARQHRLLAAACFGDLPTGTRVDFRGLWGHLLEGETRPFQPADLLRLQDRRMLHPHRLGMHGIDLYPRQAGRHECSIFWMDATSLEDIVDFWNLKATGYWVLPLPMQWADELRDGVRDYVHQNYRPARFNKELMYGTTFIKSRHTSESDLSGFLASLRLSPNLRSGQHMTSLQRWVPRIHSEWGRTADGWDPCSVVAERRELHIGDLGDDVRFETLAPSHAERYVWGCRTRYANVLKLRVYDAEDTVATVIPPGLELGHSLRPLGALPADFRAGRDGLTMLSAQPEGAVHLPVPTSWNVFSTWLVGKQCSAEISDAGHVAEAMLEHLGGLYGVRLLQGRWIIDFLDSLVTERSTHDEEPRTKHPVQHVRRGEASRLKPPPDMSFPPATSGDDLLRALVKHGVLEVGAELQCEHCRRRSWFPLDQVRKELTCGVCTRRFSFPALDPPRDPWRYRPVGPFSLPDYGAGCYTVLLALYFFTKTLNASATVVPSFNLALPSANAKEIDFAMLWRESKFRDDAEIAPVFGECVSLNAFVDPKSRKNDVAKMRAVGRSFPGAVLVFATLAEKLHARDRRALQGLARRGRQHWKGERWLNPVLVLTARELMSFQEPPKCWEDVTGPVGDFARKHQFVRGILDVCDLTQQLYLGLPPRHEWLEQRWKARAERRRA
jgi:hypothetical protein